VSRILGLVVVLVLLGGCSAQADPAAPADPPATSSTPADAPYRLDRGDVLGALRSLGPPGFRRVLTCPTRNAEGCRRPGTEPTRWFVATQMQGADLPRGNGLGEFVRTIVTAWPSPAAATSYAARLTQHLRRYRGEYDIVLKETGPRRYIPADRGRGELARVSFAGWRGVMLRRVFHYVFYDFSPSAPVPAGHAVLRQGRYVLDLEWVARDQATDRRLSQLPRRLLRGFG
jgi:hypothetical protein